MKKKGASTAISSCNCIWQIFFQSPLESTKWDTSCLPMMHRTSPAPTGNLQEPHIQGKGENRFKVVQVQGENCRERKKEI
jgi:hypothetical protein